MQGEAAQTAQSIMTNNAYIRWFDELGHADVASVGGKNASLGEMYRQLRPRGLRVPNGFAITAEAYRYALVQAGAWAPMHALLDGLDVRNVDDLARRARQARELVYQAALPDDLATHIRDAHARLQEEYGPCDAHCVAAIARRCSTPR